MMDRWNELLRLLVELESKKAISRLFSKLRWTVFCRDAPSSLLTCSTTDSVQDIESAWMTSSRWRNKGNVAYTHTRVLVITGKLHHHREMDGTGAHKSSKLKKSQKDTHSHLRNLDDLCMILYTNIYVTWMEQYDQSITYTWIKSNKLWNSFCTINIW